MFWFWGKENEKHWFSFLILVDVDQSVLSMLLDYIQICSLQNPVHVEVCKFLLMFDFVVLLSGNPLEVNNFKKFEANQHWLHTYSFNTEVYYIFLQWATQLLLNNVKNLWTRNWKNVAKSAWRHEFFYAANLLAIVLNLFCVQRKRKRIYCVWRWVDICIFLGNRWCGVWR